MNWLICEGQSKVNAGKKEKDYLISLASQSDTIASFLYFWAKYKSIVMSFPEQIMPAGKITESFR